MLKAIAIDDEPSPIEILKRFASKCDLIDLKATFHNPEEAAKWLQHNPVDLLLLDINMPSISGIDFYKNLDQKMMVIFTTAFRQFAVEGFNLNAIDFLLKPFNFDRFVMAIERAHEYQDFLNAKINSDSIYIKSDYSVVKINPQDIVYIEAYGDYLKIFRHHHKLLLTRMTMKEILELLPEDFMRVHRSYIVPTSRIDQIKNREIIIGDMEIPIGKTYWELLKNYDHNNPPKPE